MILHIMRGETESIVTLLGEINNTEEIAAHFIDLGILSWDSTSSVSEYEVNEAIKFAWEMDRLVKDWLKKEHPELAIDI